MERGVKQPLATVVERTLRESWIRFSAVEGKLREVRFSERPG